MILVPKIKNTKEYEQYIRISTQLWGGVPVDTTWARETNLYKETMKNEDRILGTLLGLIAGAYYGFSGIPHNLINPLTMINKITNLANGLYAK